MPRAPRIHLPGALYHTMARGNRGQRTFEDKLDYQTFLKIISELKTRKPFLLHAYCLMPNHLHLLMEVNRFSLATIMQNLLTRYSKRFNIRHQRLGHLFQGRYKAIHCQKDAYLQELVRYIHLNPVRAKLIKDPKAWAWSSHRQYLGHHKEELADCGLTLSMFHSHPAMARGLYTAFVRDGLGTGHQRDYYPSQTFPCLGDEAFASRYRELLEEKEPIEKPRQRPLSLERLAAIHASSIPLALLSSRSQARKITAARRDLILQALGQGHRPASIAAFLRCSPSAVSKIVNRNLAAQTNRLRSRA